MDIICNLCAGSPCFPYENLYRIEFHNRHSNVDICIGKEVENLTKKGVVTYGCCCGHGESNPCCLVDIKSKELLESLGYTLHEYSERHSRIGKYEIYLKTNLENELKKMMKMKTFRYIKQSKSELKEGKIWTS